MFSLYHYLLIIIFLVGIIIYAQFNLLTKKKYIKAVYTEDKADAYLATPNGGYDKLRGEGACRTGGFVRVENFG